MPSYRDIVALCAVSQTPFKRYQQFEWSPLMVIAAIVIAMHQSGQTAPRVDGTKALLKRIKRDVLNTNTTTSLGLDTKLMFSVVKGLCFGSK